MHRVFGSVVVRFIYLIHLTTAIFLRTPVKYEQNMKDSLAQPRNTNDFYLDGDPLRWVDESILEAICDRAQGKKLLDLGCGVGGYSRMLMDKGFEVIALDVNEQYVSIARSIGVDARVYDGHRLPIDASSVDSTFLMEVLEHVPDCKALLREIRHVTRNNVIATVPNNTQRLNGHIAWSHMLDVDHKNFFSEETLEELLKSEFRVVDIRQILPVDSFLAQDLLPYKLFRVYDKLLRIGLVRPRLFYRLLADAKC